MHEHKTTHPREQKKNREAENICSLYDHLDPTAKLFFGFIAFSAISTRKKYENKHIINFSLTMDRNGNKKN
jgi:hypothetical protein